MKNSWNWVGTVVPLCLLFVAGCSDPSGRDAASDIAAPAVASAPDAAAERSAMSKIVACRAQSEPITYNEAIYCSALAERMGRDSATPERATLNRRLEARANAQALRLSTGIVDGGRTKTATDVMKETMDLSVRFSMEEMARNGDEASSRQLLEKRQAEFEVLCGRLQ